MHGLGLDLRLKVSRVDLIDNLRAQFVCRKLDTMVGRPLYRVNVPGGVTADKVVPSEDGLGLSLTDLVDVSDDIPSPKYPF
ncbi:unnamed protein product [Linum trigynum]|uniref:Uncharacterized protein n=1 Tax=Linum trigynum TaxID=586398 RepID=A0AAV2FU17_9ROSI